MFTIFSTHSFYLKLLDPFPVIINHDATSFFLFNVKLLHLFNGLDLIILFLKYHLIKKAD